MQRLSEYYGSDQDGTLITIVYETMDYTVSEEQKLVTVYNFISQIGGNLGMFLGFSVLSVLFSFYGYINNCHNVVATEANLT